MSANSEGGYLVTETGGAKHLPTMMNGKPDHHLMGAAWAALHEGMDMPGMQRADQNQTTDDGRRTTEAGKQRAESGEAAGENYILHAISDTVPDMDLENRILRNVVVATRRLATDGCIIVPRGIDTARFEENPIVTADHDPATKTLGPVIARSLSLKPSDDDLASEVQFAETPLAREYGYLYGLNPKKEVYMRAWSIDGGVRQSHGIGFQEARNQLGRLWDETLAGRLRSQGRTAIQVVDRFQMRSFAATKAGADRGALTRAFSDGIAVAGDLAARLDLDEARTLIRTMELEMAQMRSDFVRREIDGFNRQIQALARDGADAAGRGDSSALLEEIRNLKKLTDR